MVLREPRPLGFGRRPDRHVQRLGQGLRRVPAVRAVHGGAEHQHRASGAPDLLGEVLQPGRIRRCPRADRAHGGGSKGVLVEVVHRQRQEDRAGGRLHGCRIGLHESGRHVAGAHGFIAPFHPRARQLHRPRVGEVWFDQQHLPCLLPGGDDQRRLVVVGADQAADRMANPGEGVQVHQRRLARCLRVTVGHRQHGSFLQAQHVGEVVWEVLQERLLRGSGIAEDRAQAKAPQQVKGGVPNRGCHMQAPPSLVRSRRCYCRTKASVSAIIWSELVA